MLMGDYWHDAQLASHFSGHDANALGQEYLINNAGLVTPAVGTSSHPGSNTSSFLSSTISSAPPPTLVGSSNGLQIDLVWDSSVAHAPKGFMQAIIDAAAY
jgi:hypothetical protein